VSNFISYLQSLPEGGNSALRVLAHAAELAGHQVYLLVEENYLLVEGAYARSRGGLRLPLGYFTIQVSERVSSQDGFYILQFLFPYSFCSFKNLIDSVLHNDEE
jgi:hypothetical protein